MNSPHIENHTWIRLQCDGFELEWMRMLYWVLGNISVVIKNNIISLQTYLLNNWQGFYLLPYSSNFRSAHTHTHVLAHTFTSIATALQIIIIGYRIAIPTCFCLKEMYYALIVWRIVSCIVSRSVGLIEDNVMCGVCFIDRESCAVKRIDVEVDINTSISSITFNIYTNYLRVSAIDRHD